MTTEVLNILVREDGARVVKRNIEDIGNAGRTASTGIGLLKKALVGLAAIGISASFGAAIDASARFGTKMAEVSTLVDTTKFRMDALTNSIKAQSIEFGAMPVDQAAAAYQIISAGASTASKATEILTASNKLAVGGVTDVATAADGLTSVLNAYGDKVAGATAVSDALFVGMRAGKTTIGELSAGLGKVAPLAAQTGVKFDELVGATAALTKGGISTQESITGLRAILAAVAKPTKQASDVAAQLGLDFSVAAIEAQGFGGFLDSVVTKTGGSTDALAQLFGGVEALVPALALAGQAGKDFDAIMADMGVKAGATQEAFEKMSNTFEFQRDRLKAGLTVALIELGDVVTTALTPALRFLADNMDAITRGIKVFAVLITAALIPALASATIGFVAMAAAFLATPFGAALGIITALSAAVAYFGETQVTIGGQTVTVWQAVSAAAATAVDIFNELLDVVEAAFVGSIQVASDFFDTVVGWLPKFSGEWDSTFSAIGEFVNAAVNAWIGIHVGFFNSLKPIVTDLIPGLFKTGFGYVKNFVLDVVEYMVNMFARGVGGVADALSLLPGIAEDLGDQVRTALMVDFSDLKSDTDALGESVAATSAVIAGTFQEALQTDYVGKFNKAVEEVSNTISDKFNANLKIVSETQDELLGATNAVIPANLENAQSLDMVADAADKAAKKTKEVNEQLELQKRLLDESVGARQEFINTLQAVQTLLGDSESGFTQNDAFGALSSLFSEDIFQNTQEAMDLQIEQVRLMYEQIDALRQADIISEQTAQMAKAQASYQLTEKKLQFERDFFGTLAQLSRSKNRELAAIGKAAAVTQVTIDGVLAVQKALASYPPPINFAMAAAVGTVAAANVAQILTSNANFATGGSFTVPGTGGVDSQMVAIRATPGERIAVQTPTQVRKGTAAANGPSGQASAPQVNQRIVNVLDPALVGEYLTTPEGEEVLVNVISRTGLLNRGS